MTHVYIASQTPNGAVLHLTLENDCLTVRDAYPAAGASYLALDGDRLYVLLREPFRAQSGVLVLRIRADGSLVQEGGVESTRGAIAAYILRHRKQTYVVNYISGTTIRMPDQMIVHLGRGTDPVRQDASHPHCIIPSPDGERLLIADLGTDSIYITDTRLRPVSTAKLPDGVGPRHLLFSPDGQYCFCVCEMGSLLCALRYHGDALTMVDMCSTLPPGFSGESQASALRLWGDTVFASNRGHDSIVRFAWTGEKLRPMEWTHTGGRSPRDFHFVGGSLICGNDGSATVTVFDCKNGAPIWRSTLEGVEHPWSIVGYSENA